MQLTTFIFLSLFCSLAVGYHILGIFPIPGYSHFIMFQQLMTKLAQVGHFVDVVGHFPLKKPIERYTDLSIRGVSPMYLNNVSFEFMLKHLGTRYLTNKFVMQHTGIEVCKTVLKTSVIRNLWNTRKKYDLLITHLLGLDCFLVIGEQLNIPAINVVTSVNLPWGDDKINNPDNPSYIPSYFTPYSSKMTFIERTDNALTLIISKIWHSFTRTTVDAEIQKNFDKISSNLYGLERSISLILINTYFSLHQARPVVPNFKEVGGLHIYPSVNSTVKNIDQVLNGTATEKYKGVIFFSLGSMVLTETLPFEKLSALLNAFGELPYLILLKATKEKMPNGHPNTKLFVTHGGLMGIEEAMYCGVPCFGIPLFADQKLNVKSLEAHGLALSLDFGAITKAAVLSAVNQLLNNPRFKYEAEIASYRFRDRPLSPLDEAVYWVEYVIRHNGTKHMRSSGTDLYWYQYHLLDVGAILVLGILAILYIIYKVGILLLKMIDILNKTHKKKIN